jgi:hypothetical protein
MKNHQKQNEIGHVSMFHVSKVPPDTAEIHGLR